jgi:putative flippase GtrA
MVTKQFFFFMITGGVAASLNWGSRFFFSLFTSFEAAVILAFITGLISGFVLMRFFVFEGIGKPVAPQIGKYLVINLLALLQTLLVSVVLARWILPLIGVEQHTEALAHFFGVLVPVVTSYFGHKYLTFR